MCYYLFKGTFKGLSKKRGRSKENVGKRGVGIDDPLPPALECLDFYFLKAYHTISLKRLLVVYLTNNIFTSNFRNSQQKNFPLPSLSDLNTRVYYFDPSLRKLFFALLLVLL